MASSSRPIQAPRARPGGSRGRRKPARGPLLEGLSRRTLFLSATGLGLLVAAALIGLSLAGTHAAKKSTIVTGVSATAALLTGVPQSGTTLGSPNAPYQLVEYADLQCPYCGLWARDVFPAVVRSFVRAGKLQIVFRGLTFVGPDSKTALESALGAASQHRFWNVLDLLYRNQGTENTGWVTEPLVRNVLSAVPGLDVSRALAERDGPAVASTVSSMARIASLSGIDATPTFELGARGGTLRPLAVTSFDPASFTQAISAAILG